jgi:cysteine desulfurase / selenocysteine lyase
MFDARVVRKDFPIFDRKVSGDKALTYLDSGATSLKPRQVIEAMNHYDETCSANVHRGVYSIASEATELYEGARADVARFIGGDVREVIFTKSCTEAINLVANAWGRANLREGDEVLITDMEHHSNLIPWQLVAAATGAKLVEWRSTDAGFLDMDALPSLLTEKTKLVCVTKMSNVLGTINDIRPVADAAHAMGALVLVDGAQGVPHAATDVVAMGADFLSISGHKMLGPSGSGALWARREILEAMPPFLGGGEMILEVYFDRATWNEVPYKFEAGTPNIASSIGLGAAVRYLEDLGMENVRAHEKDLTRYALDKLGEFGDITIHGPRDVEVKGGVVSFWLGDVHPHDLATILDTEGICIRAGHHCAQLLMRRFGVPATARASFYVYNTTEDVDVLIAGLQKARETMTQGGGLPF